MNVCNVAQIPQLLFPQHKSLFKRSYPFRLSLSFPYDVSYPSEMKTILLLTFWFWLWRRMFFLWELEFPQAARWACLFPEHFKACTVLWPRVTWYLTKVQRKTPFSTGCYNHLQRSGQPPQRSLARPRSPKLLKYVLSWQRSRTANLVGEGSWQSSVQ